MEESNGVIAHCLTSLMYRENCRNWKGFFLLKETCKRPIPISTCLRLNSGNLNLFFLICCFFPSVLGKNQNCVCKQAGSYFLLKIVESINIRNAKMTNLRS